MRSREKIQTFFVGHYNRLHTKKYRELLRRMRGLSGSTYRFRPVIVGLFFLLLICCLGSPAGAASSCGLSENVCPVCSTGGLALNDSSAWDNSYPDNLVTPLGFAGLTCNYGNPLSGNTVTMKITCYKDAGIAQKWYQFYRKEIPYPFPETGYGSGYAQDYQDHRVGVQAQIFGKDDKPVPTFKTAYQDWDYAVNGRYEAEIFSLTPTDTITQQEASAINVKRIQQFTGCFASFSPGGVPAPAAAGDQRHHHGKRVHAGVLPGVPGRNGRRRFSAILRRS